MRIAAYAFQRAMPLAAMPLLRRPHGHHRDIRAQRLAAHPADGIRRRNQDRYIMIEVNSGRHPIAAPL
jgi:hypothetical protein